MPRVRVTDLSRNEVQELARTLARAFTNDPMYRWLLAGARYETKAEEVFATLLARAGEVGVVRTSPELDAVAVWLMPGRALVEGFRGVAFSLRMLKLIGSNAVTRGRELDAALAAAHPPEPHAYLMIVGVDPAMQRRGKGTELVRAFVAAAEQANAAAYLETSVEHNVGYYEKLGFEVRSEIVVGGSLRFWTMQRG
jgi:ribosomal protein S18 acetylase RimI-like enzyme